MFWLQTKSNENNNITPKRLVKECENKKIERIVIGNQGYRDWLSIYEAFKDSKVEVIYGTYKKGVLWLLKGDALKSGVELEKYFETGEDKYLNPEMHIALQTEKSSEDLSKISLKIEVKPLNKNEEGSVHLQRVRYIEPSEKYSVNLKRKLNGENFDDEKSDEFLKPEKFLSEQVKSSKEYFALIKSHFTLSNKEVKMEYWNDEEIEKVKLPKDWNRFFDRIVNIPENKKEQKKIMLLIEKSGEGYNQKIKTKNNRALNQLKKELSVVVNGNFYDYFLIIEDIVNHFKQEGVRIGVRGSSVSSFLAYTLGITSFNPLNNGLFFERFLNESRSEKPDIDLEIPASKVDEVKAYLTDKYGEENTTQLISFNRFGLKNSEKEVGKIMEQGTKRAEVLAEDLSEYIRSTSVQKSSLVINNIISQIPSSKKDGKKILDMINHNDDLHKLGIDKLDLLPSRLLDKLEDTWELAGLENKKQFTFSDEKTYELLTDPKMTEGIFQLKSDGMKDVFSKVKPKNIADVMLCLAIYRPGAAAELDNYLSNRKNGSSSLKDYKGIIPGTESLEPILKETCGIIVYQEQIMLIAMKWAGMSLAQADIFRSAISSKDKAMFEKVKNEFVSLSDSLNREKESTMRIFNILEKFAEYGFPKSHALAYARLTYEDAYLKSNFPLEYKEV